MWQHVELPNSSRHIFRVVLFALCLVSGAAGDCILLDLNGVRQKEVENLQSSVPKGHLREVVKAAQGLVIKKLAGASCL